MKVEISSAVRQQSGRPAVLIIAAACTLLVSGCSGQPDLPPVNPGSGAVSPSEHSGHQGVHGGHVIEIGDTHAYHAEMVFDAESRDITLYFYGAEIGSPKIVSGLVFEVESGDREMVLESVPDPLAGESVDESSRFRISGQSLPKEITSEEQLEGHFHVTIDGQEYGPSFHAHAHGHHDHDH